MTSLPNDETISVSMLSMIETYLHTEIRFNDDIQLPCRRKRMSVFRSKRCRNLQKTTCLTEKAVRIEEITCLGAEEESGLTWLCWMIGVDSRKRGEVMKGEQRKS